jgi:hypothetical protein
MLAAIEGEQMAGDWAEELGDAWVTVSPGIYVRREDLRVDPAPNLRLAEGTPPPPTQPVKLP